MYYNQIHLKHDFKENVVTITLIIQITSWSFREAFKKKLHIL